MSDEEPTTLQCPKCARNYRLGRNIPSQFACTSCGTVMDLSGHGSPQRTVSPVAPAALAARRPPSRLTGPVGGSIDRDPTWDPGKPPRERRTRPPLSSRPAKTDWMVRRLIIGLVVAVVAAVTRMSGGGTPTPGGPSQIDGLVERTRENIKRMKMDPVCRMLGPAEDSVVDTPSVEVTAFVLGAESTDTVTINGEVAQTGIGMLSKWVNLKPGLNSIEIALKTGSGVNRQSLHVTYTPKK